MSRIYFHSPSETREIYGRERARMGCLTDDVAAGILIGSGYFADRLAPMMPSDAFPLRDAREKHQGWVFDFAHSLRLWMKDGNSWVVDGERYDCWQLDLNTVLAVGNDALKLCARLHGQCEIHAYVEGPNRAWLADIIRQGVRDGVMRDGGYGPPNDYGKGQWSELADWLESRSDEPVVCSYSVCDQFPNRAMAGWEDDADNDRWYDLPAEERWRLAMIGLREDHPRLTPDGWSTYRFGHGKDAFWLLDQAATMEGTGATWAGTRRGRGGIFRGRTT
jgi:hypothetical protein